MNARFGFLFASVLVVSLSCLAAETIIVAADGTQADIVAAPAPTSAASSRIREGFPF